MIELNRTDYMYIIIIILLVTSLIWLFLPFVYMTYNGNIDSPDCIADTNSIQCIQNGNNKICDYNCTYKDGSILRRKISGGV